MVFCTYCGQSFTRDEHLERHILTHTNVKPFKCFTCHMSFARRDLLQRHYQVHGRDQNNQEGLPPNPMIPKSAGRTPIACSNCAKTKTKCDKKFPCSRCASRNLKCTLRPTRRASKNANRIQVNGDGNGTITPADHSASGTPSGSKANSPSPQPHQVQTADPMPSLSQHTSPEAQKAKVNRTPSFFEMSPPGAQPAPLPTTLSPLPTPGTLSGNGFANTTPISGFEEFAATREGSEIGASPRYMMDWSQLNFSPGPQYEQMGRPDMMLGTMAPSVGLFSDPRDPTMLTMIPEYSNGLQTVQTPIATPPRLDGTMCDLEIGSSAAMLYPSTRHTSVSEAGSGSGDIPAIIAAQDGWNCFRSGPTLAPSSCPRTARLNLERLERSLKNHEIWSTWQPAWEDTDTSNDNLEVVPLHECSRDKLLAITQTFLHKALEIHKDGNLGTPVGGSSPSSTSSNFVLLPPSHVLQYFLRAYSNSFERFFPMTSRGVLDANEQLRNPVTNDKAASLLTLMMIAQGAMSIPSLEARWLNGGLTEACRISLFDLIEKNIGMASDQTVLHSALLFTASAAWSGDKWQMDIAMGQRGMYFAMLRHSGVLEPSHAMTPPMSTCGTSDGFWSDWIQQESKSRLIYSWVMVDQDLSLFRDTAPLFNVTEFGAPMPDADRLWRAKSSAEWSALFEQVHQLSGGYSSIGSGARPLSLRELFRHFLDDEIMSMELTPLHLRLLLHPLQSLVCQYCQLLSCFSDTLGARQRTKAVTAASTRCRLEEVQALLQRWYDLADRYIKSNPACAMMQSSLTIFHLISLNAVTNFPEVERLARKEGFDGSYQQLMWIHKRCISDVEEATFHAGQVLRLIRSMPRNVRPPWWAGAIYRVALILWTDSLTHTESISPASGLFPVPGPSFAVDALAPDHPLIIRYLQKREGVPALTKRDGSQIALDHAFTILSHCVDVIDEGVATRFSDGIRNKLERLARGG